MQSLKTATTGFFAAEDGAVTVDWVVMTAALVGLGLATTTVVSDGLEVTSVQIASSLSEIQVRPTEATPFERNQWTARTGNVEGLETWMAGFTDENLMAHMNNQAQFADGAQTGHPYDTYHDEYWVARDEAVTRGLIPANQPV